MKGFLNILAFAAAASAAVIPRASNSSVAARPKQLAADAGTYWLEALDRSNPDTLGKAPYTNFDPSSYPIFRNVKTDFGAAGDGNADDTDAIQNAINAITPSGTGSGRYITENNGQMWMASPAAVYFPAGTYKITKHIDLRFNTILTGDPTNKPTIVASQGYNDAMLLNAKDAAVADSNPTKEFFMAIKNIDFDTTGAGGNTVEAIDFTVSQACQLSNIKITMPLNTDAHTGVSISGGSLTGFNDVEFHGGKGIYFSNQQANIKGMKFYGCSTAIQVSGAHILNVQDTVFENCGTGVDLTQSGGVGLTLVDTTVTNSGPAVRLSDSAQVLVENLKSSASTNPIVVDNNGNSLLPFADSTPVWMYGKVWQNAAGSDQHPLGGFSIDGKDSLLDSTGAYFTMAQPTYADSTVDDIVNIKAVSAYPVKGDGSTNDVASLNAILADNAKNNKISYFPYGVYSVEDTLVIPAGSRIYGEAWPVIKAQGGAFSDDANPKTVVQVGNANDKGVAQIQDMRVTPGDIMPGAKLVEINIAGTNQGDVALWNTHMTVGGTAESKLINAEACGGDDLSQCMAAWGLLHLTPSSGVYLENVWGWVSDHGLDSGTPYYPFRFAVGRGMITESTNPTWLHGVAMEHCHMYNFHFNNAENVYTGMLQTETAYYQGTDATARPPAPFTAESSLGEPDFSWCGSAGAQCFMTLGLNVEGGSNLFFHATGVWTFFNYQTTSGGGGTEYNAARVGTAPTNLNWFMHSTHGTDTMILDNTGSSPRQNGNPGGWDALISYLQFA